MKYAWIEIRRDEYTVGRLCRMLSVSHTGYCQWRVRTSSARTLANEALDAQVAALQRLAVTRTHQSRWIASTRSQRFRASVSP